MQRFGASLALLLASLPGAMMAQSSAPGIIGQFDALNPALGTSQSRIAGDWHSGQSEAIAGSRPPFLHGATDLGQAPLGTRLDRMLLLLEPSAAQRQALDAELANQLDAKSAEYHHWLTPSQFAVTYANSMADVSAVVSWLQSEGFEVAPLPASRGWIEFSGSVSQVQQAFQTRVHSIAAPGGTRLALADSIAVPAALRPLIHGLVSLDGVVAAPALTALQPVSSSAAELAVATPGHAEALTPQAAAQILHLETLHSSGAMGAGQTIAIAARSSVQIRDVADFRNAFGLQASPLHVALNGPDPGRTNDEAEAVLSASWAGVAAPVAQIVVVPAATTNATDGLDLSLAAIIDASLANTVAVGFSACEASLSETHQAFYAELYRRAAAQGTAVIAASGDSGPSACHVAGSDAAVKTGYGVNALASTPWNTAVGASALAGAGSTSGGSAFAAWAPRIAADPAYAGGGGSSTLYSVPAWQPLPAQDVSASGVSSHSSRLLPDVALPTAVDGSLNLGLAFCLGGPASSGAGPTACNVVRSGGSAVAAALFAGIAAVIAEKNGPQGNLAAHLYKLSGRSGVFDDIEQGNARLFCEAGSAGCDASGQIGFSAAAGYDLATGLGSVNAEKLLGEWAKPEATGTGATSVLLTVSPMVQNNTYNPSAQITFAASVTSLTSGATPTGTVTFSDATSSATITIGGSAVTLDSTGKASVTVNSGLPVGGNNVTAQYSGDANYAAAASSPPFVVTIAKSQTTPAISAPAAVAAGASFTATVTITAGTPPEGSLPPGGAVTMAVDGVATATANLSTTAGVTSATFTLTAPTTSGSHNLQTTYPGDSNYSSSVATVAFTISKAATITTLTATPGVLTPGTTETLTASVAPLSSGTTTFTITGTVAFFDGSVLLGTAPLSSNSASLTGVSLSTSVSHSLTAVYSGDSSWATSTSNPVVLTPILLADSVTLTVSPPTTAPGQVVTLIATVTPANAPATTSEQNPTGNVIFYNGATIVGTVALTAGPNHTATATLLNAALPSGTDVLTAYYVGDSFYEANTSNSISIDVEDFSITPSNNNPPTNLNIVKGSSGSASFVVKGLGGFNNQVQVVCAVPTQDDMTCQVTPQQVTPTATVTFTVQTYAAGGTTTADNHRAPLWPRAAGGTALAVLVFFVLPFGRQARIFHERRRRFIVLVLLLAGLSGAGIGCNSSVTLPQNSGTPLGVATLTITAASYVNNTVVSHSVYLTVNVIPPGSAASVHPITAHN
jgi:Pro-kumamolisin, activation domain/Bacterial Ig-like domain (group 3)